MVRISIVTDYITLGQLLKLLNIIGSGGEAKHYLGSTYVMLNGEQENRRGKKIYPGDHVVIDHQEYLVVRDET